MTPALKLATEATNRIFEQEVGAKRNVEVLDRVYTVGARILPPGAPMLEGRENIKAFWRGAMESLDVRAVKLETVDFEEAGEAGIEIGRATLEFNAPGSSPAVMKYVVVWKQEDGAWKWAVDIWNPAS
jgi:ketosteroid isomerase-like protein